MADLEIRPTLRFIRLGYLGAGSLLVAALIWLGIDQSQLPMAATAGAAVLLFWPAVRHLKRQRLRCLLEGGQLRYHEGLVSTTVRTIPVANIQDVTVRRGPLQRLFGVGDIRIETAGDSSAVEIHNVDDSQSVADRLLAAKAERR